MDKQWYEQLITMALNEDLHDRGDISSQAVPEKNSHTLLVSKDTGVLAGGEVFAAVFERVDPRSLVKLHFSDGDRLKAGDLVAEIEGSTRSVLTAERTALNFLSFLSGMATATDRYVREAAACGRVTILDTRKTLPGFRQLSKYAVRVGGGTNHRMGLYDMVMLKDNHNDLSGSITQAVAHVRDMWSSQFRIEVECRNLSEVREALSAGVDVIMLDNMNDSEMTEAVSFGKGTVRFEASGGVSFDRLKALSATGVDYVSIGRLTHSVTAFDFSMQVKVSHD